MLCFQFLKVQEYALEWYLIYTDENLQMKENVKLIYMLIINSAKFMSMYQAQFIYY